ncbi:hypothetical protein MA16_Dca016877 [Dendrobium catenatum]|uniref:Uncharacterized protein n=1 Tax=Dendrobium catenatum TaxID=906689 RepID=A0A2I0WNR6_9ASPA|nr:hypothetical protein MA16_Dca016877 [Dendrobium catenatum]
MIWDDQKKIGYIIQADTISSRMISLNLRKIVLKIALNRFWLMSIVQSIVLADPAISLTDVIADIEIGLANELKSTRSNSTQAKLKIRFHILMNEVEEGEVMIQPNEDKTEDLREAKENMVDLKAVEVHNSNLGKCKLAKELKSLGPVEPEHRKKRRDGKGNLNGGDGSPLFD